MNNKKNNRKKVGRPVRIWPPTYEILGRMKKVSRQRVWEFINRQGKSIDDLGKLPPGKPPLITEEVGVFPIAEYARRQGITKSQVYYKIKTNKIKFVKKGNNFYIDTNDDDDTDTENR